jgi:hypothetical protein
MPDDSRCGPSPERGSGNWLTHILIAVLRAVLAAGRLLAFNGPGSGGSGISLPGSGAVPAPGSSAAQSSGGEQATVTKVRPGLAIINTTPRYDSEAAAGTGMVINADGLVLTNNHVVDDSTKDHRYRGLNRQGLPGGGLRQDRGRRPIPLQNASGLTTARSGTPPQSRADSPSGRHVCPPAPR